MVLGMRLVSRMLVVDVELAKSDAGEIVVAPIKRLISESNATTINAINSPLNEGLSPRTDGFILT